MRGFFFGACCYFEVLEDDGVLVDELPVEPVEPLPAEPVEPPVVEDEPPLMPEDDELGCELEDEPLLLDFWPASHSCLESLPSWSLSRRSNSEELLLPEEPALDDEDLVLLLPDDALDGEAELVDGELELELVEGEAELPELDDDLSPAA